MTIPDWVTTRADAIAWACGWAKSTMSEIDRSLVRETERDLFQVKLRQRLRDAIDAIDLAFVFGEVARAESKTETTP